MNKKKVLIHIIVPVTLAIVTNFVCLKIFYVPNPYKPGTAWITYAVSVGTSILVLGVTSVISALHLKLKGAQNDA
ncbi:MAG: hypothetical protein HDQ95_03260 [Roseburia sp.]|nr:hypothetical protein [Roseburia sp.]